MMQKTLFYWLDHVDSETSTKLSGTCRWTRMDASEMTDDMVWHEIVPSPKVDAVRTLNLFSAPIIKYCVRSVVPASAVPME